MSTKAIHELSCDRCKAQIVVRKGDEHGCWATLTARQVNGPARIQAPDVGQQSRHVDICEDCLKELMDWWTRSRKV
jgi:hypothetical protein